MALKCISDISSVDDEKDEEDDASSLRPAKRAQVVAPKLPDGPSNKSTHAAADGPLLTPQKLQHAPQQTNLPVDETMSQAAAKVVTKPSDVDGEATFTPNLEVAAKTPGNQQGCQDAHSTVFSYDESKGMGCTEEEARCMGNKHELDKQYVRYDFDPEGHVSKRKLRYEGVVDQVDGNLRYKTDNHIDKEGNLCWDSPTCDPPHRKGEL